MSQRKSLTKLYDNWLAERELTAVADNHHQQQRRVSRIFVKLPAWVTLDSHPSEHVAFVRDISTRGIFLYSDFLPRAGYHLNFILQYLNGSNNVRLHLGGKVVRLEQTQASAVGIAVAFAKISLNWFARAEVGRTKGFLFSNGSGCGFWAIGDNNLL